MKSNCFSMIALAVAFGAAFVVATATPSGAGLGEDDALTCYKMKDSDKTKVEAEIAIEHAGSFDRNCTVKGKAKLVCLNSTIDGSDDPRGVQVSRMVCYKLKCTFDEDMVGVGGDTRFGEHDFGLSEAFITYKMAKQVCVPMD